MIGPQEPGDKHRPVRPGTIRRLSVVLAAILALTAPAQALILVLGHFGVDGRFGVSAAYGPLTCVAMIVAAKVRGIFLMRQDSYHSQLLAHLAKP